MNRTTDDSASANGFHRSDDELAAAWIFAELAPDEREAFDARLESEPDLRERCEEFAATSRRVRDALGAGDTLPAAAHEALARAGAHGRPRLLPKLRITLAAASLAGVSLLLLEASRESGARGDDPRGLAVDEKHIARLGESNGLVRDATDLDGSLAPSIRFVVPTDSTAALPTPSALPILPIPNPVTPTPDLRHMFRLADSDAAKRSVSNGESVAMIVGGHSEPDASIRARVEALYGETVKDSRSLDALLPPGVVLQDFGTIPEGVGGVIQPPPDGSENVSIHLATDSRKDFFLGGFLKTNEAPRPRDTESVLRECERRPNERPADMYFRFWGDNAFERTATDPLSTFAIDVDGASYALAREYLERGLIPEKAQVRTEEFVNYFRPDVAAPVNGPLAIVAELAPSPFSSDRSRSLLRVALRARELAPTERGRQNLMLVVDVSGSMKEENRLELVKHALRLLAARLAASDHVGIAAFSDEARLVLPMTLVSDRPTIESAIHGLTPSGSTNAAAGLRVGFSELAAKFDVEAENRVVLFSDGVANVGATDAESILAEVSEQRSKGIYLSTIGVGMGNHNDVLLEQLADRGDGACAYVDSDDEAKRAIVDRFSGAFVTVARDVKVQVEFDPAQVERYRLLGYENRAVADADFRNDAVDGGEIGAGEQVTALYEFEPTTESVDSVKPLAAIRVRWLPPHGRGDEAVETAAPPIARFGSFDSASPGFRRSALVAQFSEFLRRSTHARGDSIDTLITMARTLSSSLADPEFDAFVRLTETSRELVVAALPTDDPLAEAIDAVRRNRILRAEIEDVAGANRAEILKQLEDENRRLEELLKKLLGR